MDQFYYPLEYFQSGIHGIELGDRFSYTQQLSRQVITELQDLSVRLQYSLDNEKYPCESYYDYVCGRQRPLFTTLGHLPSIEELIELLTDLQQDNENFQAKKKLMDFFVSCSAVKNLEDCYYESFVYFRPLFGYIIIQKYIGTNSYEQRVFLELLEQFLRKSEHIEHAIYLRNIIRLKLNRLREYFHTPQIYFRANELDQLYRNVSIYRQSYKHNVRTLLLERRLRGRSAPFETGVQRTMLDWTLYLYQSRRKPMSYYYATFGIHLWMTLFNATERYREPFRYTEIGECLKLPQHVNVLQEAVILAIVYLKSFRYTWLDYDDWIKATPQHQLIYNREDRILAQYNLSNKRLFFTLFAQNFCDFGKELAENIFYLSLHDNLDFQRIYGCTEQLRIAQHYDYMHCLKPDKYIY